MASDSTPLGFPGFGTIGRRSLLVGGMLLVAGCTPGETRTAPRRLLRSATHPRRDAQGAPQRPGEAPACRLTEPNELGPYYVDGAPPRTDLASADIPGERLTLEGTVLSVDCRSPLAGASIEIWQADGNGRYDIDGTFPPGTGLRLRGRTTCDAKGAFSFRTVVPGHYLDGGRYRPAHIHVKVVAPRSRELVTQLYFPGDPHHDGDRFFLPSLVMDVDRGARGLGARYDFVLDAA